MATANLDILKFYDKCFLVAYDDGSGVLTIGWGHTGPDVHRGLVWTQAQADAQLSLDMRYYEEAVERVLVKPMSQWQFDAVVDLAYNAGVGASAAVIAKFNVGDMLGALMEFSEWNEANFGSGLDEQRGLTRRRTREIVRWTTGL